MISAVLQCRHASEDDDLTLQKTPEKSCSMQSKLLESQAGKLLKSFDVALLFLIAQKINAKMQNIAEISDQQ